MTNSRDRKPFRDPSMATKDNGLPATQAQPPEYYDSLLLMPFPHWIAKTVKTFGTLGTPSHLKVQIAEYLLRGWAAEYWKEYSPLAENDTWRNL